MAARLTRREIGDALLELRDEIVREALGLVEEYRMPHEDIPIIVREQIRIDIIRKAVDTPSRARACLDEWRARYDARNGTGAATTFLASCLSATGASKTLPDINAEISTLESQALVLVDRVNVDGWPWDQVADEIEAQFSVEEQREEFSYQRLPLPKTRTDVWGIEHEQADLL